MILRRPYAFLIKFFKVIHIIMFIFFTYFVFVLRKIYVFFAEYVKNSNFTYFENITTRYVPIIVFFMVVLLLGAAIGILSLMRRKNKPVLYYKVLIGYCSLLLVVFIYFISFFSSLETTVYEPLRVVVNRDIILFVYLINYFFVAFSFIRGFGFDIKKFSFEKDKKELNFDESDSEEYELNVKLEKEDVQNYLNRQKRELKYYIKENALVLSIVIGVIIFGTLISLYLNFFVYNKIYHEGDEVSVGNLSYIVNSSKIINVNKYGKTITNEYDYLIIDLTITNNEATGYLDSQALRVHIDDEYYYPHKSSCYLFSDIGKCYENQKLENHTVNKFILVYRVKKDRKKSYMEILKNKNEYQYSRISLNISDYKRSEEYLKLNDSFTIGDETFHVDSFEILNRASYQYRECVDNVCDVYSKAVSPKLGDMVLSLNINNLEKMSSELVEGSFSLKYDDKILYGNDMKYLDRHGDMLFYSIPSSIKNVSNLVLTITTRGKVYYITLNGGQ